MNNSEWKPYTIADIGEFIGGGTPSTAIGEYWDGDIHWTTSKRIGTSAFLEDGERFISKAGLENSSTNLIPRRNLLIGTRVGVGKVAVNNADMAISQDLTGVIVDKSEFNPVFLAFCLLQPDIQNQIIQQARGVTIKGIPREDLKAIRFAAPDKSAQEKTAAVLWRVQCAIETEEKVIATVRELKQTAMRQLFARGLRGEPQRETEIGSIPRNWSVKCLEDCCDVVSSSLSYTDLSLMAEDVKGETVLAMGIKVSDMNLAGNESEIVRANLQKRVPGAHKSKLVPPNTVVFPKRGAAIATNKKRMTTALTVLDPNLIGVRAGTDLEAWFLFYWFQKFDLRTITEPGPTPQLNKKNLTPLLLPVPNDPQEQVEIVSILQTLDRKISLHERKRATLKELFGTMLHQLMVGEISVADLDIDVSEIRS